ncbi:MAG: PAS domain-containing protein [Hyphomicrobiaceae bacterium]
MSKRELKSLLETYNFLDRALKDHSGAMSSDHCAQLAREQASVVRRMLALESGNPAVVMPQLKALLACLQNAPNDRELVSFVAHTCQKHIEQLSEFYDVQKRDERCREADRRMAATLTADQKGWFDLQALQLLDVCSDRIAVIGRDYRYICSNITNAHFHACTPAEMVDRPLWVTTSAAFFATVSKPVFDRCLAGCDAAFTATHPSRVPSEPYEIQLDPIRDAQGSVVAAFCIARRIAGSRKGPSGLQGREDHGEP